MNENNFIEFQAKKLKNRKKLEKENNQPILSEKSMNNI